MKVANSLTILSTLKLQVHTTSCSLPLPACLILLHFRSVTDPYHPQDLFSKTYHFSPGVGGLAYLGLGIGFISATMFGARFADQIYKDVNIYLRMSDGISQFPFSYSLPIRMVV
jgi:hypothetical protein